MGIAVDILYEEGPCLVALKPPGLLTQAPPGIDSMELRLKVFLREREKTQGKVYLGVPHRLDRPASGAMVFARHVRAARRLAAQFEARRVEKLYWALVEGVVTPAAGTWTDCLRKIPDQARAEVVAADHPEGRQAVLHYRTRAALDGVCWLEIELETGRTHQVRIQAASRGHPILGDGQYGARVPFGIQHEDERLRAIALHARSLRFSHPKSKAAVCVTAPVGEDWHALIGHSGDRR